MCLANISRKNTNYSLGSLWIRLRYQNTKYSALPTVILLFLRPHYQVFRRQRAHAWVPLYIAVSEARREWPYEGENQPVLVSEQTSTGQHVNQYWSDCEPLLVVTATTIGCFSILYKMLQHPLHRRTSPPYSFDG